MAFIANKSLPIAEASEGYLETIPELIVEIRSKNGTLAEMGRKAEKYLSAGVERVWLVDPLKKTVVEQLPDGVEKTY